MVEFALELPQLEYMMTAGRFSESGFEKSENGTAGGVPEPWPRQKMPLLEGESLTNVVSPIAYALARRRGGGGEFEGALHITNFRIALERTGPGKATFGSSDPSLDWVCFPMGCIKAVTQASEDPLAITVIAKDMRSCRMRFFYHNPLFVSSLTQIMGSMAAFSQTSPEKAFAITHATAVHRNRRRSTYKADSLMEVVDVDGEPGAISSATAVDVTPEVDTPDVDGWLVYDEETEFVRQGVIKPKSLDSPQETDAEAPPAAHSTSSSASRVIHGNTGWRMYHNRSHRLVPTYPLHFVVPAAMSDADVRAVAAYRCKGRLPTVTWMDPQTKAVLARSAQPLAGLGGNSCAEDERLLRLLSRQGRKGLSARTATKPETRVAEPAARDEGVGRDHDPPRHHPRLRSSDGNLGTAAGSSINTPGKGSNNSGEGSGGAAESESSGGLGGEDIGDKSFLEMMGGSVGMPSWTTPWSITRVNIQQPAGSMEKERHAKSKAEIVEQRNLMKDASGEVGAKAKASGTKRVTCGPKPSMSTTFRGGKEVVGGEAGDRDPELCVLDARTAVSALGNQLVGKGVETGAGYGSSIQLVFSGIGNIHAVKDAFEEMRNSLDPLKTETETRSIVDKTSLSLRLTKGLDLKQVLGEDLEDVGSCNQWSRLLRQILAAGVLAAKMLRLKACSVLVHCSDGWDRTPQICSTVGLLLDPYYRTAEGFCVLIEKDWLSFGHKFWARCMGGSNENAQDRENVGGFMGMAMGMSSTPEFVGGLVKDYEELSPVFIQFLDVVHNLLAQFPTAFEFTEDLLVFVAEHTFSGLFGTFLCDTDRRRRRLKLKDRTVSIWTAVLNNKSFFTNADYTETEEPLWPSLAPSKIRLWERQYWRVPSLRPSHPFTRQVWEDHIAVTIRLLGASNGVPPEGVPREDSEGDGSGE